MQITIMIDGGLGKQMCAASAVHAFGEANGQKVNVITGWPDAWKNHPWVADTAHFMDTRKARPLCAKANVLRPEPYRELSYRLEGQHLIAAYMKALGVPIDLAVKHLPLLKVDQGEREWAQTRLESYVAENALKETKGTVAFMPFGGQAGEGMLRSLPQDQAQMAVEIMKELGWAVFQFRGQTDTKLKGIVSPDLDVRYMISLVTAFDRVVTVDTWLNHAAAALDKKALVFWGASSEKKLGYEEHKNARRQCECKIWPCGRPEMTIPDPFVCPYDGECLRWEEDELRSVLEEYLDGVS